MPTRTLDDALIGTADQSGNGSTFSLAELAVLREQLGPPIARDFQFGGERNLSWSEEAASHAGRIQVQCPLCAS
jgi:hypothetical protein